MRNILGWKLVILLLAVAGFIFYAVGSFTTSSEQILAVKHFNDGRTWTLKCTTYVTHRSELSLRKNSEELRFYVVTDKGQRRDFSNDLTGDITNTQFGSISGTANWVGVDADTTELVVFLFDGDGKILSIEKLDLLFYADRKNLKTPLVKILEKENSVVYMTKDGYMKYNYVDKTKSRYEGTLE